MPKAERKAQKSANEDAKSSAAAAKAAAEEAAAWEDGAKKAKAKDVDKAAAAAEKAKLKAEAEKALALETESAAKQKVRGAEKVAVKKSAAVASFASDTTAAAAPVLVARGIDAALAVMQITESPGGSSGGGGGGGGGVEAEVESDIERARKTLMASEGGLVNLEDAHPEKRMKAAYMRYKERELPILRKENPALRLTQHLEVRGCWKSPSNLLNFFSQLPSTLFFLTTPHT